MKQWRFVTSSHRQSVSLAELRCKHDKDFKHASIEGSETKRTETYTLPLCRVMLSSLFGFAEHSPCMPCQKATCQFDHRMTEPDLPDSCMSPNTAPEFPQIWDESSHDGNGSGFSFGDAELLSASPIAACVTKLLDRKEWRSDPKALDAIKAEASGLLAEKTWLEETVIEKADLLQWANHSRKKIHIGDLLLLCSIKYFEMPEAYHKHKGRICFRGDNARDEKGAYAVYQELSASPTSIHTANCNIAYGCLPGHKTTQADAIRAYIQALLGSLFETYVRIPWDLWPQAWKDAGMHAPCCKLNKSLYGHPEAGGHWERHLHKAIQGCGGIAIDNHPSSYWIEKDKLFLTVYVDDLLLSGPESAHAPFWTMLQAKGINIDPPEELDRFLGRSHVPM